MTHSNENAAQRPPTTLLATADEMREMDRRAIEELGIPGVVLMENAGVGTTDVVEEVYRRAGARGTVAIVCGAGNNGGDGYVVARHLHQRAIPVAVFQAAPDDRVEGDARVNLDIVRQLPIPLLPVQTAEQLAARTETLRAAPVLVDALLGTGLAKEVRGHYRALIDTLNACPGLAVAVDVPSGVRATDGAVLGAAVRADVTATFAITKLGLIVHPGAAYCGDVRVVDIGIPRSVVEGVAPKASRIAWTEVREALPPRPAAGHKGTFGHCLVVAGSPGKGGAALLAGEAALRGGAGLVTIATDETVQGRLEGRIPELMVEWFRARADEDTDPERMDLLLSGKQAVVIGPGLGATPETESMLLRTLRSVEIPVVLDADALNLLARHPGVLRDTPGSFVLTPHPGEMARLLDTETATVQSDRVGAARSLAERENAVVVLKGAGTIVAEPDGTVGVNTTGNPGMGSAGTGDVLAGLLGGLLAQRLAPAVAARVGVLLHGMAGDEARGTAGLHGLTAGDVLRSLPAVLRRSEAS